MPKKPDPTTPKCADPPPTPPCATNNSATTKKYLKVARWRIVTLLLRNGSVRGATTGSSSRCLVWYRTRPAMPASSSTTDSRLHMTAPLVGRLATSGSYGQFEVYVTALPGRSVEATQLVHQKKRAMSVIFAASVSAPGGIA